MADLKPPLKGYSLWLEAKKSDQQFLQSLVDSLAQEHGVRSFGAHATLIGLLDKGPSDLATIAQACEEIASGYRDVTSEIIGVGIRDMYFQSVFLLVTPTKDLVDMNQKARTLLGHESDSPFMPHWSALYGDITRHQKDAVAQRLITEVSFPHVVTINNIALVDVQGYEDEWKVVRRYPMTS
ncbi:MAG: 2'-5' RNA ligase family protein [Candidatus Andersenbacteria bacterium]